MSAAMIWDVILILQIELSRSAINKAVAVGQQHTLLSIHLFFAISTVVLYGVMIYSGRKVLTGEAKVLKLHKRFGITTLTLES